MGYFLTVLGLVCFLEGLPYCAAPEKMKKWLRSVLDLPSASLRFMGGLLMVVGLILVYVGRRYGP